MSNTEPPRWAAWVILITFVLSIVWALTLVTYAVVRAFG